MLVLVLVLVGCAERAPTPVVHESLPPTLASAPPSSSHRDAGVLREATRTLEAGDVVLPIPARSQARESPRSGWCGETAIQEALLYLGVWAPQRLIHKTGNPSHPDLYSNDIPVALTALGVEHTFYRATKGGFESFAYWIRTAIDAATPVLAGVKILPTAHPEWGLDHFVLVVGYGERGLLVNTTWGTREWVRDTDTRGLSFKNAAYAIRIESLRGMQDAKPARISVLEEGDNRLRVHIACINARYRIERKEHVGESVWLPVDGAIESDFTLDVDRPARFRCVPTSS